MHNQKYIVYPSKYLYFNRLILMKYRNKISGKLIRIQTNRMKLYLIFYKKINLSNKYKKYIKKFFIKNKIYKKNNQQLKFQSKKFSKNFKNII